MKADVYRHQLTLCGIKNPRIIAEIIALMSSHLGKVTIYSIEECAQILTTAICRCTAVYASCLFHNTSDKIVLYCWEVLVTLCFKHADGKCVCLTYNEMKDRLGE